VEVSLGRVKNQVWKNMIEKESFRIDWWICKGYTKVGEVITMKKYTIKLFGICYIEACFCVLIKY
jgi:hypothetical protein